MRRLATAVLIAGAAVLALGTERAAGASRNVAALQIALHGAGVFAGNVDGVRGPQTVDALRRFQRRRGLVDDGVAGPQTRAALGRRGRPAWGSRTIKPGMRGWDVAALQFALASHGFPCGPLDGGFGPRAQAALLRFQRFAGLPAVGVAGPATRAALRRPPPTAPLPVAHPIAAPIGDRWGARGAAWHPGLDFPASAGTPVAAARSGVVVETGSLPDGYGRRVVIDHGLGERTLYAHLSAILVAIGQRVGTGTRIGRVGSTGFSTGPHLHFEVRVRGAAIDPAPALTG
jgi:murein DD-endopeptidase MepM/ murein hydrolase activator NlpD